MEKYSFPCRLLTTNVTQSWLTYYIFHQSVMVPMYLLQVYVEDVLCGEVSYSSQKHIYEIPCNGVVGRNVKVQLSSAYQALTLCEVEVFGGKNCNVTFYIVTHVL